MIIENAYDLCDETILQMACTARIYDKLVATWRANHRDDLLRMFEETPPGSWAEVADDLKDACEAWVAGNAREAFAGGLEVPGDDDAERESYDEETRGAA